MIIKNIQNVNPDKDSVIVRLLNVEEIYQDVITQVESTEEKIEIRIGKVISMGPDVILPEFCSMLQVDDNVIFSQFAGYMVATDDGSLYKSIGGYDIIGITTNVNEMNSDTLTPTADRLLVEVLDKTESEDGLVLGANASDPRLLDLTYGKVVGIGLDVKNRKWTLGSIVAFPSYVGTEIRAKVSSSIPELRMVVELDVQFHL